VRRVKIIAGLGNPGPKYRHTRHNLGFEVIDLLAERLGVQLDREKGQGLVAEAFHAGQKLLLVKPLTFMNRSGECLAALARNRVDTPEEVMVVADDIHLPLGRVRIRRGGSAGGHNGLKSVIERLGSPGFPRVRLGVGQECHDRDLADYVLAKFYPGEWPVVREVTDLAAGAVLCWLEHGVDQAMNQFNR
jgi:PTH1 family peptidyl-tRNA hydrolase